MKWNEGTIRRALSVMGFEEIEDGIYIRLDSPQGRARTPHDARLFITVRVRDLALDHEKLERLLRRYPRVHGAPVR